MDKWKVLGYVAAIFNPIPTGLIAGYCLCTEEEYRGPGRNVLIISILWAIFLLITIVFFKCEIEQLLILE